MKRFIAHTRTDSVICPKCGAKSGQPCRTPSGVVRRDYPHLARRRELDKVLALVPLARATLAAVLRDRERP